MRCPDPSCGAAIGQDMVNKFGSDGDKEKYRRYLLRSYVEDSRKVGISFPETLSFHKNLDILPLYNKTEEYIDHIL